MDEELDLRSSHFNHITSISVQIELNQSPLFTIQFQFEKKRKFTFLTFISILKLSQSNSE